VSTGENTYRDVEKVKSYKKLTYKNVYDGIDAVFVFHEKEGIKYSFIVQPGADISKIKMKYPANRTLQIDNEGNLHIETSFGDIVDHAPFSFYQNNQNEKIVSQFVLNSNEVSFKLDNYNKNLPVVIDPWTVTPNAFPNSNKIFIIEVDQNSNVYVYGGDSPMRLRKYNSAGVLQWT